MGKTIQAISLIMTHRTDDPAKLPPVIPAAAASGNVGISARAVVRKVLDPSRPKLRLGGARPRQAEEDGSGAQADVAPLADAMNDACEVAAADDADDVAAEEPHRAHTDGTDLRSHHTSSDLYILGCTQLQDFVNMALQARYGLDSALHNEQLLADLHESDVFTRRLRM